jgi:hypothetical protein
MISGRKHVLLTRFVDSLSVLSESLKHPGGAAYDIIRARSQKLGKIRLLQEGVAYG